MNINLFIRKHLPILKFIKKNIVNSMNYKVINYKIRKINDKYLK